MDQVWEDEQTPVGTGTVQSEEAKEVLKGVTTKRAFQDTLEIIKATKNLDLADY